MVIRRIKGDNYPIKIQILSEDGTPFNLTGTTVFFTVKKRYEDNDNEALIAVETTVHANAIEGITEFNLLNSNTLIVGSFIYDVKVKLGGTIYSVLSNKIIFENHVTIRTS